MNPWIWRIGIALGAGAVSYGVRRYLERPSGPHRPRPSDDLFPDEVTIMGHRGAAGVAPENTMAAFGVASRLQLPIELDVQRCKTGEVVVFHDRMLNRTTDGSGSVADKTLTELRQLDAGSHFDPSFAGQRIPTLDTVLATIGGQVALNIEIKAAPSADDVEPLVKAVLELIEGHGIAERVVISAFDPMVLETVRRLDERVRRGQIIRRDADRTFYEQIVQSNAWFTAQAQPDLLMIERTVATSRYVSSMKRLGYRVFAWTVNDEDEAGRLVDAGIDGLITDDPQRIGAAVRERARKRRGGLPA